MEPERPVHLSARLASLAVTLTAALAVLGLRLWQLQVLQADYYAQLADSNRLRVHRVTAPRGLVLDRRGTPLVVNRPAFSVSLLPMEVKDPHRVAAELARALGVLEQEVWSRWERGRRRPYEPVRVRRDVGMRVVTWLEERREDLPGVQVEAEPVRVYPFGSVGAHVLGYLGEVSQEELEALRPRGYRPGDLVGKAGVERSYDVVLRGDDGEHVVEVDAAGRPLRVLREQPGRPGNTLVLTLDWELQQEAERQLGDRPGAVVAMDPRTGEVLAMASSPSFDPNAFAAGIPERDWQQLSRDRRNPLMNRATASAYEPGSVFKVVTGLAALQEGRAAGSSRFVCTGSLQLGRWVFRDLQAHGVVDFATGVAQSCNVMFWTLGRSLGPDALARYARQLGFGQPTGIDLPPEAAGVVPDADYKRRVWHEPWYPGDTLNMAIGQGFVLATPIQVARAMSAVANGGTLLQPRVTRAVLSPEGQVVRTFSPVVQGRLQLSGQALRALRRSLEAVVERGTGRAARVEGLRVAGKTGSAEVPRGRPHAWFAGYAPAEDPRIVVVVLVEHGYRGGLSAAPIAQAVLSRWWAGQQAARPQAGWAGR
ncbi:MAG: penicillin-binding protein 2 [Armatimonadota bacterium]|nr:penicillin-binding protein 2 [Armatimonadota bacterium]MDW8157122.1 penicillin-binding protein 2 [Armatimonadota bacterium]